jgi:hypothetical protein
VYSELLSDILSDNDNCLAKILVIQNLDKWTILKNCSVREDVIWWYAIAVITNNLSQNISFSDINLADLIELNKQSNQWWIDPSIIWRTTQSISNWTWEILKLTSIMTHKPVITALWNHTVSSNLVTFRDELVKLLEITNSHIKLLHSNLWQLWKERWWEINIIKWVNQVYLVNEFWEHIILDNPWDQYLQTWLKPWETLDTYDYIVSTHIDTIATSHLGNVILRYVNKNKWDNKITWESKWGIIDPLILELANLLLKKWLKWKLTIKWKSFYLNDEILLLDD